MSAGSDVSDVKSRDIGMNSNNIYMGAEGAKQTDCNTKGASASGPLGPCNSTKVLQASGVEHPSGGDPAAVETSK